MITGACARVGVQALQQLEAVHARHLDVEDQEVEFVVLDEAVGLFAVTRGDDPDIEPEAFERHAGQHQVDAQVVDQQYLFHGAMLADLATGGACLLNSPFAAAPLHAILKKHNW